MKTERGRRVFPQSDRAQDVLDALLRWAKGARLRYEGARELMLENGRCTGVRLQSGEALRAGAVLVATGGVSYPVTGSTGDGYRFARQAGHTVMPPEPSLVSLVERGGVCRRMMGLSLKNVALTLYEGKKALFCEQGEMLFTHFGMSGPLVLSASAHIRDMKKYGYRVCIDLKPALPPEKLYKRVSEDFALLANREAANCLVKLLPASMQPVMLDVWGMDPQRKVNQITREERRRLVELLKAFPSRAGRKGRPCPCRRYQRRRQRKGSGPQNNAEQAVSGAVFRGRGAGCGRVHGRLQPGNRVRHSICGGKPSVIGRTAVNHDRAHAAVRSVPGGKRRKI